MKLLLIHPKFPYRGKDLFPLGLSYLAAIAKKKGEVRVVDENIGEIDENFVREFSPELIGISCTTPSFSRGLEIMNKLRVWVNRARIFFGGTHVTFKPEEAINAGADFVIRGEGEATLEEILEKKPLNRISGISYKSDDKIVHNPDRGLIKNLDALPSPAYEFFPIHNYGIMSVITSRGCPYSCIYCCASRFWGNKVRFHSIDRVHKELITVKKLGFKKIRFMDSIFNLNKERTLEICEIIKDMGFIWSCEVRADLFDEEIAKAMSESGCFLICVGVDSASQRVLDACNRKMRVEDIKNAFKIAKKFDIRTRAYVTFGFPGENEKSVVETIKFLKEVKPDKILLSLATAYPGTKLEESGRFIEMHPSWVAKFHGHGYGARLYLPEGMSKREYIRLADLMYKEIKKLNRSIHSERYLWGRGN